MSAPGYSGPNGTGLGNGQDDRALADQSHPVDVNGQYAFAPGYVPGEQTYAQSPAASSGRKGREYLASLNTGSGAGGGGGGTNGHPPSGGYNNDPSQGAYTHRPAEDDIPAYETPAPGERHHGMNGDSKADARFDAAERAREEHARAYNDQIQVERSDSPAPLSAVQGKGRRALPRPPGGNGRSASGSGSGSGSGPASASASGHGHSGSSGGHGIGLGWSDAGTSGSRPGSSMGQRAVSSASANGEARGLTPAPGQEGRPISVSQPVPLVASPAQTPALGQAPGRPGSSMGAGMYPPPAPQMGMMWPGMGMGMGFPPPPGGPPPPGQPFNPYMVPPYGMPMVPGMPPFLPPGMPPGAMPHGYPGTPTSPGGAGPAFPPPFGMMGFPPGIGMGMGMIPPLGVAPPPLPGMAMPGQAEPRKTSGPAAPTGATAPTPPANAQTAQPPSLPPTEKAAQQPRSEVRQAASSASLAPALALPLPPPHHDFADEPPPVPSKDTMGGITPRALPENRSAPGSGASSYFDHRPADGRDAGNANDAAYGIGAMMLSDSGEDDSRYSRDQSMYSADRSSSVSLLPDQRDQGVPASTAQNDSSYTSHSRDAHRASTVSIPTSMTTIDPGGPSQRHRGSELAPSWTNQSGNRQPARWVQNKLFLHQSHALDPSPGSRYEDEYFDDRTELYDDDGMTREDEESEEEAPPMTFFYPALLSHVAVQLRDRIPKSTHTRGGLPWPMSFTGQDLVNTIQEFLPPHTRIGPSDHRFALVIAHSLQNQLFFVEVNWDVKPLRDSPDDVFQFMNELDGMAGTTYELPAGIETMVTKCYSPSCQGDGKCYSPRCPFRTDPETILKHVSPSEEPSASSSAPPKPKEWSDGIPPALLAQIPESEQRRQTIIFQAIMAEEQYEADLNATETLFISPLRIANPPIVKSLKDLEDLIQDIFGNVLELRDISTRVLEFFAMRRREEGRVITTIGDIFLSAAAEFHNSYPAYVGHLPKAEDRLRDEMAENAEFRFFVDRVVRQNENRRMDIKHLIYRPSLQLQRYPQLLEAILKETPDDNPDAGFLAEAIKAIRNLSITAQLRMFQATNGKDEPVHTLVDPTRRETAVPKEVGGTKNWYHFVSPEEMAIMTKEEKELQENIWELIKGEMSYVADLRAIDKVYVQGLRYSDQPIIERSRLELFIDDVFHNYANLLDIHERLLESLHNRQMEQHPRVGAIGDLIYDAALQWQEVYLEYTANYPKAKYALEQEVASNRAFAQFLDKCRLNPLTSKQGPEHFLILPIQRLLRYNLLLNSILKMIGKTEQTNNPDIETIPMVTELIGEQAKQSQKGVVSAEGKVSLWQLPNTIDGGRLGEGAVEVLDLRNPMRELVHRAKVYRQQESSTISSSWTELTAYLFDTYFVLTKQSRASSKHAEGPTKYVINRRPIPVELMTLGRFDEPAVTRSAGIFRRFNTDRHETNENEGETSRQLYPFTYSEPGGQYTLWTDSAQARSEWKTAFLHAKALRQADLDANKIFDMTLLSTGIFSVAPNYAPQAIHAEAWTGRVVTTVPFRTADGRELFGAGTAEGVWLGLRADPKSMRKVLHLKAVTQIAVLQDFSLFLVLTNKSLLAYPLEALVPTTAHTREQPPRGHQKISDSKHEIMFFAVGQLNGRTLVITMRQKGLDSIFRCLEPIANTQDTEERNRRFGALSLLPQRSDWFRLYKEFFVASTATYVHFLRNKLVVVTQRSFEIIDLSELMPATIPAWPPKMEAPILALKTRAESAKPLNLFRASDAEFLLCYDTFAFYVDRHGFPSRAHAIDYEGRPECIAFHPPYVLLFAPGFVEIRHVSNMRLIQIVIATDVRCSFDGQNSNPKYVLPVPTETGYKEDTSLEPRVHMVKRAPGPVPSHKGFGQEIYELTPTLLLSAAFPMPTVTDSNYFPPAPAVNYASGSGPSNIHGYSPWSR